MTVPCPLVNPLCPSDLCVLDANHDGGHVLGTMASPEHAANLPESERYELSDLMFLAIYGTPREELIRLGHQRAMKLWPEQYGD